MGIFFSRVMMRQKFLNFFPFTGRLIFIEYLKKNSKYFMIFSQEARCTCILMELWNRQFFSYFPQVDIPEPGCAILRGTNKYICAGDTAGKVNIKQCSMCAA